jgi:hypothetical protein
MRLPGIRQMISPPRREGWKARNTVFAESFDIFPARLWSCGVSGREIVLSGISLRRSFPNESLGLLGTALLLVAWPTYADQSDPVQAVPVQPDGAALLQKIRDLEDRVRSGRFARLKTEQAPPRQPATTTTTAVPNCRVG